MTAYRARRLLVVSACLAAVTIPVARGESPVNLERVSPFDLQGGGGLIGPDHDGPTELDLERVAEQVAQFELEHGPVSYSSATDFPGLYSFFPMAGNMYRDVWFQNFVDQARGSGILDWDCTGFTYNGHLGHDVLLRTFGEQAVGVPIFAAMDGRVLAAHDGEPDMNVVWDNQASNFVVLDHGGGRFVYYWHMKRGSVAVTLGQVVRAGEQIGLTGSSGVSNWPHLHFETRDNWVVVEPFAGPCRPGPSGWTDQVPISRETYLTDFGITRSGETVRFPYDVSRTGSLTRGFQGLTHWIEMANLPANSTYRVRYRRPDGSLSLDSGTRSWFYSGSYRFSWWWWRWYVDLDVTGTWHLEFDINGQTMVEAPFEVVVSPAEIVNRAPEPIRVSLDPPAPTENDVVFCRVDTDLVLDDLDYDIVRYEYNWRVNDEIVRTVTTAAHSDAIPHHSFAAGDVLECTVTPTDAYDRGETASTLCGESDPICIAARIAVAGTINPRKRGVVRVVLFGNEALDVDRVDVTWLRFGPDRAPPAHDLSNGLTFDDHHVDVDGDGLLDLVMHFRVRDSGIGSGEESVVLLGKTIDGQPIKATDAIRTLADRGPPSKAGRLQNRSKGDGTSPERLTTPAKSR